MTYVFAPSPQASLPIHGSSQLFPVHRVYCIGRNYGEHAREMGHDPDKEPPFFFQKNPDNLRTDGKFPYPPGSKDVHYEIELIVALRAGGSDVPRQDAMSLVFGYAIGLDMTRRDLQAAAKASGRPWEVGKAFEHSAPCTRLYSACEVGHPGNAKIWLDVNGERRQSATLDQMIWDVSAQISYISGLFTLAPGDLIMTGTPAGVGATTIGDRLHGHIDGIGDLHVEVVQAGPSNPATERAPHP